MGNVKRLVSALSIISAFGIYGCNVRTLSESFLSSATPAPSATPISPTPTATPKPATPTPTPTVPTANYHFISPSGSDTTGDGSQTKPWKTLSKATTTVTTPGHVIIVLAGTYTETVTSNLAEGVSIEGKGIDVSIVKSSKTGDWSTFLSLDSPVGTSGSQSISDITFDGQYVSESNYKTWWGILVSGRSNVTIHHTKIIGFYNRGVIFDGNKASNPLTDPGHYATGNKFYNNSVLNSASVNGIYGSGLLNIGGQTGMEIFNNSLVQDQRVKQKNGWPIKYWENGWLRGVRIHNNTLVKAENQNTYFGEAGDWDFAIELFNFSGLEIANNVIQGSIDLNYNYKGTYAYSAWIHGNVLNHASRNSHYESGIILEFATQSMLIENNSFNNYCSGVQFNTRTPGNSGGYKYPAPAGGYSALTDNTIRNNLMINLYNPDPGNVGTGAGVMIITEGTDDPYVRNLSIDNNIMIAKPGYAPYSALDFSSQPKGDTSGINIRNNIVMGFSGPWLFGSQPNPKINGMKVTNNIIFGNGNGNQPEWPGGQPSNYSYADNIIADPQFMSSTSYHLKSTSPGVNKGIDVGMPYVGSAPDIGAYEDY